MDDKEIEQHMQDLAEATRRYKTSWASVVVTLLKIAFWVWIFIYFPLQIALIIFGVYLLAPLAIILLFALLIGGIIVIAFLWATISDMIDKGRENREWLAERDAR